MNSNCFSKFSFTFSNFSMAWRFMALVTFSKWHAWPFMAKNHWFLLGIIGTPSLFMVITNLRAVALGSTTSSNLACFIVALFCQWIIVAWKCFKFATNITTFILSISRATCSSCYTFVGQVKYPIGVENIIVISRGSLSAMFKTSNITIQLLHWGGPKGVALLPQMTDLGVNAFTMCFLNLLPRKTHPNSNYTHDAFGYYRMKLKTT